MATLHPIYRNLPSEPHTPTQANKQPLSNGSIKERSLELFCRYQKEPSTSLRDELLQMNIGLVYKEVHRCKTETNETHDDLRQVGSIGLLKAIERFNSKKGFAFSSFAIPYIRGEIRHYLRDKSTTVRIPRRWHDLQIQSAKAKRQLQEALQRPPTEQEIANWLDISIEEWQQVRLSITNRSLLSLDRPVRECDSSAASLGDLLSDSGYQSFQLSQEDRLNLQQALSQLEQGIREAIEFVFIGELTHKETARRLGVTTQTISRRITKGLIHLKTIMAPISVPH